MTSRELLPIRNSHGNKSTFGKLLILAGAENMAGAALLCGRAAYRTGCGMVKIISPSCNRIILQTALPEALYEPSEEFLQNSSSLLNWAKVCLLGPGLSTGDLALTLLKHTLNTFNGPMVLDADAINLLGPQIHKDSRILDAFQRIPSILTPHVGEFVRLYNHIYQDSLNVLPSAELIEEAQRMAKDLNSILVLKDYDTYIVYPEDKKEPFAVRGSISALAKAGSGDVLAGIIAGLVCQTGDLAASAVNGVLLHANAGRFVADRKGDHYVMASDLIDAIGQE